MSTRFTSSGKSGRELAAESTPPGLLVLRLYDAALRSLECALTGFDAKDPGERDATVHNHLQRTLDIVCELNCSLNHEAGSGRAEILSDLYGYFQERLQESNLEKIRDGVDAVIHQLNGLRDAWVVMLANRGLAKPLVIGPEVVTTFNLKAAGVRNTPCRGSPMQNVACKLIARQAVIIAWRCF